MPTPRTIATILILALLGAVPLYASAAQEPFYLTLFGRILVYAIACVSLNLLLGYAGLVSFGHALFFGLGAYAVGISSYYGIESGWAHLAFVVVLCAVVGLVSGWVVLRTSGIAFIMITLAFAQMFYFLAVSLNEYGGDDGMSLTQGSSFGRLRLDDPVTLYYTAFVLLLALLYGMRRLVDSRFGMAVRGIQSNERRMRALGFSTFAYKLAAYVLAAVVCGLAGMLIANMTLYVSPSYMAWTTSGDMVVMLLLGGMATVMGPVVGAIAFLILEEVLKAYTDHWMLAMGLLIVVAVLVSRRGLFGALPEGKASRPARTAAPAAAQEAP